MQFNGYPELSGSYRFVFNTDRFLQTKKNPQLKIVRFQSASLPENPLSIIVSLIEDKAVSGYGATFGGVDCDALDVDVEFFLGEVESKLKDYGVREFEIRMWPEYIDQGRWTVFLRSQGYEVIQNETNQHLEIHQGGFLGGLAKDKIKKLRLAKAQGFEFRSLELGYLKDVFELIVDSRQSKGYPVTMSFQSLYEVMAALPDRYRLYGIFDGELLIAGAVNIRVNDDVSYNFYHGDRLSYRHYSPLTMLVEGVYEKCIKENLKYLDLGISSELGRVNQGLYTFKQRLGCHESRKMVFSKFL